MLADPRPLTYPLGTLPVILPRVDVDESAGTWERILQTIYPTPNPNIDNVDDLESLLLAAKKYKM